MAEISKTKNADHVVVNYNYILYCNKGVNKLSWILRRQDAILMQKTDQIWAMSRSIKTAVLTTIVLRKSFGAVSLLLGYKPVTRHKLENMLARCYY